MSFLQFKNKLLLTLTLPSAVLPLTNILLPHHVPYNSASNTTTEPTETTREGAQRASCGPHTPHTLPLSWPGFCDCAVDIPLMPH